MQAAAGFHGLDHALSFRQCGDAAPAREKLAQSNEGVETLFMAACIITAQIVMVPMAMLVGHKADSWGRKPIFLAGFTVLPIRGVLYTLTQNPYALVSIQVLDGIVAGIFGALFFYRHRRSYAGNGAVQPRTRRRVGILGAGRRAQQFDRRLYCRQGRVLGRICVFGRLRVRRLAAAVDCDARDR
jgi:MFS family permease